MNATTFGLDLAKRVMQVHWVETGTGEICRRQLKRGQLVEFFARRAPAVVAMEACGSAHYWGGRLVGLGHQVRLIAAQFVRPFVKSNKTDAADAQAIWEAAQRSEMRFVALKSEGQQAVLMLHGMRSQLVKLRTMQTNQLRGLLYEFGTELPAGRQVVFECITDELARLESVLPAMVLDTVREQMRQIEGLDQDIAAIERRLAAWKKDDAASQRLMDMPGVGLLTATAAVATVSARPGRFGPAASLPPSSAWCHGRPAPAGGSSCWASANAATCTCARC